MKIGSLDLDTNVFLAPMAGCTDIAFRLICREHGAKFCYYEMLDSNAVMYNLENSSNSDALITCDKDVPIAAQLLGSDVDIVYQAAQKLLKLREVSYLELNAACPVTKVMKKKAGAHLLRDPKTLYKIIKKLATSFDLPITVKLRAGYSDINLKEIATIAKNCEKNGVAAIFVHGRTKDQLYKGAINYESIKAIKHAVNIPVIGSGNVFDPTLAKKMFQETDCDGVLVARGAFGNPWIFQQIEDYLTHGLPPEKVTNQMRKTALLKHLGYLEQYRNPRSKHLVGYMRKVAIWYSNSIKNAAEIRNKITFAKTRDELFGIIEGF